MWRVRARKVVFYILHKPATFIVVIRQIQRISERPSILTVPRRQASSSTSERVTTWTVKEVTLIDGTEELP